MKVAFLGEVIKGSREGYSKVGEVSGLIRAT